MKHLFTRKLMLLVAMLLAGMGSSFAFEYNGLTYRVVDNDAKTVKVSYQGSDAWSNSYTQSSIVIPSTVPFNGDTYTVVEIGEQAFTSATMSSVTIPATVKTIGNYAFQNCKYLTTIDLSSVETFGNYIMSDCYALTSVQLPKTMQSIPQGLLSRCTSITSFTFPDGVTSIEYDAFNGTGLTSIDIPESVTSIGSHSFANTALTSITTSVPAIDEGAFENCVSLTNITLYASYISKMGPSDNIFLGCNKINKIICLARNDVSIFGFSDDVKEIATVIVPESQVNTWKNNSFLNVKAADINNVGGHVVEYGPTGASMSIFINGKTSDPMYGGAFIVEPNTDVEVKFGFYDPVAELATFTINGVDMMSSVVDNKYIIKNIDGNKIIQATWQEGKNYNVTYYASDYSCGSLFINDKELSMYSNTAAFPGNQNIKLLIKPNAGYSISYFRIDAMDKKNELTANADGTYSYTHYLYGDTSVEIGYEKKGGSNSPYKSLNDYIAESVTSQNGSDVEISPVIKNIKKIYVDLRESSTSNYNCFIDICNEDDAKKIGISSRDIQSSTAHTLSLWNEQLNMMEYSIKNLADNSTFSWLYYNPDNNNEVIIDVEQYQGGLGQINSWQNNFRTSCIVNIVVDDNQTGGGGGNTWKLTTTYNEGGTVTINGEDVANGTTKELAKEMAMVEVKMIPNAGYELASVLYNGVDVTTTWVMTGTDGMLQIYPSSDQGDNQTLDITFQKSELTDDQGVIYKRGKADDNSFYYAVTGHSENLKSEIVISAEIDGCPVTTIGDYAFSGCSFTSITIPNSVTSIGYGAFYDCYSLRLVTSEILNPFDVNAFYDENYSYEFDMRGVTLVVPEGSRTAYRNVKGWAFPMIIEKGETTYAIEQTDEQGIVYRLRQADNSFYYAVTGHSENLKSEIVIPADIDGCPVKAIETPMAVGAFDGCTNLTSVKILGNQLTTIGYGAFKGCTNLTTVKMANSIRSIGDYAFFECTSLTSITLPKDLESIGNGAFSGEMWETYCPITSIHIPHNVKTIGNEAFRYCHDLALVSFDVDVDGNSALTSIGVDAFTGCSFSSITIPNSVITIGSGAFRYNNNLTNAILSDGITEIASGMFYSCGNLASITIPEGVTIIGESAFYGCGNLRSIKLPESLTSMGEYAFRGCQLKSIELPNSFTEIPANLFDENDLEYIKLGNNVKSIGKNAFGSWLDTAMDESLVVIEIGTSTPPTIAKDAFPRLESLSLINVIVPDAAAETAYRKAAVWKEMTFSNQDNISEVTVDTPGDIDYELITECNMQPAKVVNLKVKGTINAKDFDQIRTNMKSLLRLDLSECDITEIPDGALQNKTQLQELTLPTKLQTIGNYAFAGCPYLTGKLNLPSGVTSIGEHAFEGTYYTSVALPFKLKTIGSYAFYNLPIKQKINLPDALTSIGDYAFAETQISGHAELPEGINYLGAGAFRNTHIDYVSPPDNPKGITSISRELFQGCTNLDYIYIPRNFTEVSGYAFDGCTNLSYVRLSPNLETLGEYAFQNTELEYIKIPSKVKNLSEGVFRNCKNLESLSLPADLKEVGRDALRGCNALRNLSVEAIEPPTVDKSALIGINTDLCLISIPTTSYRQYVTAEYWGQFVQMRNDIAVETEGNGEIGFESVVEGEDDVLAARKRAQRSAAARGMTRASAEEEDDPKMTLANNGSSVYVPKNGLVRFIIIPGEGEELLSATLDGEDIMPAIVDGVYTATADKQNAKLVVKFSGESRVEIGDANSDKHVDARDVKAITDYMIGNGPEKFSTKAADMNNDTLFNIADIIQIVNQILSKE